MNLHANDILFGFEVTRIRDNAELGGRLVEMRHLHSGARLCWVDNGHHNKLFAIAFKTLPQDDTGVFHILEHSTLCGSKKYPVKEPFVELLKGSMKTFLNALTFPDKTVYPVSSRNDQDFLNLAGVYLDAVFAPRFLEDANIFHQEGWHIEENEGVPSYKGVVFNEMKGAMSEEGRLISRRMMKLLFPDSCYGFNSGGAPEAIVQLKYDDFIQAYRRSYHPGNARVFLDGKVPLEETLKLLDAYFSDCEPDFIPPEIAMQQPKASEATHYYEVSAGENCENKARLTLGKIFCSWNERLKLAAADVICDVLTGSNEAPLKRAVLDSGLARNLFMGMDDSIAQPCLRISFKDVADGKADELRRLFMETAGKILRDGIDREDLLASINRLEFQQREPDEPQGLYRCFNALAGWLYGGDPLEFMTEDALFAQLREMMNGSGYEELLREMLDESNMAVLHTFPSSTLGEETRKAEEARLRSITGNWSAAEHAENAELNRRLAAWQQMPDSPEALSSLPALPLSAVDGEPQYTETIEQEIEGVKLLFHPVASGGIVHFSSYFNLSDCTLEDLTCLSLIGRLLGKLPTKQHSAAELERILKLHVGRMGFSLSFFSRNDEPGRCTPCLAARCSVLEQNLPKAMALMAEILTETRFDDHDRILNTVRQAEITSRQIPISAGHAIGMQAALSHYTARDAAREAYNGGASLRWLHDFSANFDDRIDGYCANLEEILERSVCRARLTLSMGGTAVRDLSALVQALPKGNAAPESTAYASLLPKRMASSIPAQANFAVQAYHLDHCGIPFHAGYSVGASIVSLGYLWNAVRVQGGAYGAGLSIGLSRRMFSYSYRDPTPAASLEINRAAGSFLRSFCESGESIDKYIISTIAKAEPLESPEEEALSADEDWFAGVTKADYLRLRREMIETDRETLLRFADVLDRFAEEGAVCVIGHEDALKDCEGMEIIGL